MGPDSQQRETSSTRRRIELLWRDAIREGAGPETSIKRTRPQAGQALLSGSVAAPDGGRMAARDAQGYEILRWLGEGGMGVIYRSRQQSTERPVAVKMMRADASERAVARDRFVSEALATADLDHPGIVPVHDLGTDEDGCLFYAMREVSGSHWSDVIGSGSLDEDLSTLLRVADAVAFAHSKGIIHRDVKPSNVMLGHYGEVFLMDWGLAVAVVDGVKGTRLSREHAVGGTPAYMAPEMARADVARIGPGSDIYLLGAVLFELIAGRRPHGGDSVLTVLEAAARNETVPTEAHGELVDIARKAMATEPGDRYASVKAFQDAVRNHLRHARSVAMAEDASDKLAQADESRSYDLYAAAVNGYRHALKLWPGNEVASGGLPSARLAYADCAFRNADYDLADTLLDPDWPGHEVLARKVSEARLERERKRRRVAGLRLAACLSAGVALVLMAGGLLTVQAARRAERRQRIRAEAALARLLSEQEQRTSERRSAAPALVESAKRFAELGDVATAMSLLDAAIDFEPASGDGRVARALLHIGAGDYARAEADAEALVGAAGLPGRAAEELRRACVTGGEGRLNNNQTAFLGRLAHAQGLPVLASRLTAPLTERLDACRAKLAERWGSRAYNLELDSSGDLKMVLSGAPEAADLSPLTGLPICSLMMRASAARDLGPLAGLPLRDLNIWDTAVDDLTPLHGLPLTNLVAGACAFTNLAPLRGMPLLSLGLVEGRVSDLEPLRGLPLRSLRAGKTSIVDLTPLSGMELAELEVSFTLVMDLDPLRGLQLKRLGIAGTRVRDLGPLAGMPLAELNAGATYITSIAPLAGLPLVDLDISGDTAVVDLKPLAGMRLQRLDMRACLVADLTPLGGMPLRYLNLLGCRRVADLSPLAGLPLEEMAFDPQHVEHGIEAIREMPTLRVINRMPADTFWERYDAGDFAASPIAVKTGRLLADAKVAVAGLMQVAVADRELGGRSGLVLRVPPAWLARGAGGSSCYYPNGNFTVDGKVLAGQVDLGPIAWDPATGGRPAAYDNGPDGAKSVVQLGGRFFLAGDDGQGVRRLDPGWQSPTPYFNPDGRGPESITTDGESLFANDDRNPAWVHSYSVANAPGFFHLKERWVCDLGAGRVRGISYGGNGYLYCSVGARGDDRSVFAIRTSDGTATDMAIDVPGNGQVYGVIRHELEGSTFLLAVDLDALYVWRLASDTRVEDATPDSHSRLVFGLTGPLYGLSARDDRLFLATGEGMACLMLSLKPDSSGL